MRPGADRAGPVRKPTEPGAGGRGAFFGGRVPRQGGGHGPGGGRVAVGGLLQACRVGRAERAPPETEAAQGDSPFSRGENRDSPRGENMLAGLGQVRLRQDRQQFGPAEGMLTGAAARRQSGGRFLAAGIYSRHGTRTVRRLPLPLFPRQGAGRGRGRGDAAGGGFSPARWRGRTSRWPSSTAGSPSPRRPGLACRAATRRVPRNWRCRPGRSARPRGGDCPDF